MHFFFFFYYHWESSQNNGLQRATKRTRTVQVAKDEQWSFSLNFKFYLNSPLGPPLSQSPATIFCGQSSAALFCNSLLQQFVCSVGSTLQSHFRLFETIFQRQQFLLLETFRFRIQSVRFGRFFARLESGPWTLKVNCRTSPNDRSKEQFEWPIVRVLSYIDWLHLFFTNYNQPRLIVFDPFWLYFLFLNRRRLHIVEFVFHDMCRLQLLCSIIFTCCVVVTIHAQSPKSIRRSS